MMPAMIRQASCALALTFCLAASARAQDNDPLAVARAREFFSEGVALAQEGRFDEAARRFREALSLRRAPTVEYNLASALIEMREYREAESLLQSVIANRATTPDLIELATVARAEVRARAAEVRVVHDGSGTVFIDDEPIEGDGPVFVAPGTHVVDLRDGDTTLATRTIETEAGTVAIAELSSATSLEAGGRGAGPVGAADPLVWIGAGIGLGIAVAIGVMLFATASGSSSELPPDFGRPRGFSPLGL
jgi:tetratricopeptide (TPR) repeat protein